MQEKHDKGTHLYFTQNKKMEMEQQAPESNIKFKYTIIYNQDIITTGHCVLSKIPSKHQIRPHHSSGASAMWLMGPRVQQNAVTSSHSKEKHFLIKYGR